MIYSYFYYDIQSKNKSLPFLLIRKYTERILSLNYKQSRATWPVKWYISTAVLPSLPADSQSEMMLTSHYDLSYLVSDGK